MLNKTFIPLIVSVGLIGCGGGSGGTTTPAGGSSTGGSSTGGSSTGGSSTGGSSTGGSSTGGMTGGGSSTGGMSGNGNCVTTTRPTAGLKYKIKTENFGEGAGVVEFETTFVSFGDTSSETKTTSRVNSNEGGVAVVTDITSTTKSTYTIANNFIKETKLVVGVSSDSTITLPAPIGATTTNLKTTITTEFDPFSRGPIDRVCENQTWTDSYVAKVTSTTALPGNVPSIRSENITRMYEIQAINVSKTVPAGTFNTVQVRENDNGEDVNTTWIDIASGALVASESRDNNNTVTTSSVMLSKSP